MATVCYKPRRDLCSEERRGVLLAIFFKASGLRQQGRTQLLKGLVGRGTLLPYAAEDAPLRGWEGIQDGFHEVVIRYGALHGLQLYRDAADLGEMGHDEIGRAHV